MDMEKVDQYILKNLWCLTYAAVVAAEKQSIEIAVMQANEAVDRYKEAWSVEAALQDLKGPGRS